MISPLRDRKEVSRPRRGGWLLTAEAVLPPHPARCNRLTIPEMTTIFHWQRSAVDGILLRSRDGTQCGLGLLMLRRARSTSLLLLVFWAGRRRRGQSKGCSSSG
jgi:hypothetical protein